VKVQKVISRCRRPFLSKTAVDGNERDWEKTPPFPAGRFCLRLGGEEQRDRIGTSWMISLKKKETVPVVYSSCREKREGLQAGNEFCAALAIIKLREKSCVHGS